MPEVLLVLDTDCRVASGANAETYARIHPRFLGSIRVEIFLGSTTLPAIRVVAAIALMYAQNMLFLRNSVQNATGSTA